MATKKTSKKKPTKKTAPKKKAAPKKKPAPKKPTKKKSTAARNTNRAVFQTMLEGAQLEAARLKRKIKELKK